MIKSLYGIENTHHMQLARMQYREQAHMHTHAHTVVCSRVDQQAVFVLFDN